MAENENINSSDPGAQPAASNAESPANQSSDSGAGPEAKPAAQGAPGAQGAPAGQSGRGGRPFDKKRKPDGGPGGNPRVRMREPMPSLEGDFKKNATPLSVRDLDAEIEAEMNAALGALDTSGLMGADTSRTARKSQQGADSGRKEGKVLRVHGQDVFIDIPGGRSQGFMTLEQFPDGPPKPGDSVEFTIEGFDPANSLLILTRKGAAVVADWSTVTEGMVVEARVLSTNKGGLSVDVNGIRGFLPISQIDLYRVENAEQFVNQRLLCVITEADPVERNLVVSRRALLEKERAEKQEKLWAELEENQVRSGVVRNIKPFGAFVDLGGVDALLPVSELSWRRVKDPSEILQLGQTVKVAVLKLDRETRKITVTLKQLESSPWEGVNERFPVGQNVQGTVTRTAQFGAFVELEPGVEGLIPMSELARQKVWRVSDYAKEGETVTVRVIAVDPAQRRVTLSLRQAVQEAKPVEQPVEEEEAPEPDAKPRPERPRTTPLRGGTGRDWRIDLNS